MACLIEGVLLKRDKPKSLVQSISTGNKYLVETSKMQVRCSWATYKPIKDVVGRYYVRFDTADSLWVKPDYDMDPKRQVIVYNEYFIGTLVSRDKEKKVSIIKSDFTGSLWYVDNNVMQIKCSTATNKPIRDEYGRCQVRVPWVYVTKKCFKKDLYSGV